jgi:hypothetical protein
MLASLAGLCLAMGLSAGSGSDHGRILLVAQRLQVESRLRGAGVFRPPAGRIDQLSAPGLAVLLRRQSSARVSALSERFLGVAYLLSPLGEGPGHPPDEDPIFRLDAVDCTTFVETVMAMVRGARLDASLGELRRIRYLDGRMEFGHRKHDMLAQWLPDAWRLGLLEDITQEVGGGQVAWISQRYDPSLWAAQARDGLWARLDPGKRPAGTHRLPVVPLRHVLVRADALPDGTLLNVVRSARPGRVTRITHQGLVVRRAGRVWLRHARRDRAVLDEPLEDFVARNLAYRRWVVEGFNFQRILAGGT